MKTDPHSSSTPHAGEASVPGGEASAFDALVVGALPSLRQQALALARNRADADDLVQAAVTNALAARGSFEMGTNFRAWIGRILRNHFISGRRRHRETVDVDDAPAAVMARSGGQEESLALRELRRNLARLPADIRLMLMMVSVQGVSYEELSEQFGVPVGTLKSRVFRARLQLQRWMDGEETAPTGTTVEAPAGLHGAPRKIGYARPEPSPHVTELR